MITRNQLQDEIRAILDRYPDGEYHRHELIIDVKHDLELMKQRLGIEARIDVYLDDGELVVRFGAFPNQN
jgi:hypothetical protein